MKKHLRCFFFFFCIFNSSYSQTAPNVQWQNTIGGSSYDFLFSLKRTTDNGFILAGSSASDISGDKTENTNGYDDYWIVKTDANGSVQWQNTIGGNEDDILFSIDNLIDGGYILGGESFSDSTGDKTDSCWSQFASDFWLVKTDSAGNVLWDKTIGGTGTDYLYSVSETTDNGFILGGWSNSSLSGDKTENSNGGDDFWIVKTDSSGNIQWQNTIGGSAREYLKTIEQTTDGGYIIGGVSLSGISGDKTEGNIGMEDYWIVKIDSIGNIQWQNTIGGTNEEELYSVGQTVDGGFLIAGASRSGISGDKTESNNGNFDCWLIKTDSSGTIEWQQTIGGSDFDLLSAVKETNDGGYLLGGSSFSNISGDKTENSKGAFDYWVIKIDSIGNILWQKTIGGNDYDILLCIEQLNDGSLILGGYSKSIVSGDKTETCFGDEDFWIVKLAPDPTAIVEDNFPALDFNLFPNPSNGNIKLNFKPAENKKYKFEVINVLGETVFNDEIKNPQSPINLNLSFLGKGIYLLKISDGVNAASRLLVIE
jgi:hypothetical protein